jgi:3-oxoacyl-[acyl-carrier protein] reductase
MDLELDGRTAGVIGGSSGIGAAAAGVLAAEGCDVAVTYRSPRHGAERVAAGGARARRARLGGAHGSRSA